MAKIQLKVDLRRNDGTLIGSQIDSGVKNTKSEAEAAVSAVIQQRVDAANGAAQELLDAQSAFNS